MKAHLWRLAECGRRMRLDKDSRFEALILFKPANIFYFSGSATLFSYLIVTKYAAAGAGLPSAAGSRERAGVTFDHIMTFDNEVEMFNSIAGYLRFSKINSGSIGLEFDHLTRSMIDSVKKSGALAGIADIKDSSGLIAELRAVKDDDEIASIRKAAMAADAGVRVVVENIKPGMTAAELATLAGEAMTAAGARKARTCVEASPDGQPVSGGAASPVIGAGSLVRIELEPVVNGYHARICRTVCSGEPSPQQQELYDSHLEAQSEALRQARAGASIAELENGPGPAGSAGSAPRPIDPFVHGIGIEPAEPPFPPGHDFFFGAAAVDSLKKNTVLAVGNGPARHSGTICIGDTILAGESGCEILTNYPRSLTPR